MVEFSQFMGINLRRADPIDFATCVGSVREYHNWDVDEASNCFRIKYTFKIGENSPGMDNITWEILDESEVVLDTRGQYEYTGDDEFFKVKDQFCIHRAGNYKLRLSIPAGEDLGKFEFEVERPDEFAPFITITQDNFSGLEYSIEFNVTEEELNGFYPNNRYDWDPANSGESGITSYDNFYQKLNDLNLEVCATIMLGSQGVSNGVPNAIGPPSFIVQGDDYCDNFIVEEDDPTNPLGYRWYGDYLTQFANRYGTTTLVEGADKHNREAAPYGTAQGLVQFVENWNEQDHYWNDEGRIEPEEYAMMVSIAYDGFGGTTAQGMTGEFSCETDSPDYPLGVREMMPFVMGGTARIDREYFECMIEWFQVNRAGENPVIPFDVFNFHNYSFVPENEYSNSGFGASPEASGLYEQLIVMDNIRNELGLEFDLWLSEFGYNTSPGGDNPEEPEANELENWYLVPEITNPDTDLTLDRYEVHGQWIARSFLTIAAANFDKAFVYEIRDQASQGNVLASWDLKCGLLESVHSNYQPKKAWYYTSSLNSILEGMDFTEIIQEGALDCDADDPESMVYRFDPIEEGDPRVIYAIWSPTSCNISPYDFPLNSMVDNDIDFSDGATLIELGVPSTTGIRSDLPVTDNSVVVSVSERPIFVVVGEGSDEITCPTNLDAFNVSCSSVNIAWDIPDEQTYDHYQLWYGPLEGIATDNIYNPDIFSDDITLYDNDVLGDVMQAVIGGLLPETEYLFYVIGIGEDNSTGWCAPLMVTTTIPQEECYIDLNSEMVKITGVILDENGEIIIDDSTEEAKVPPDLDRLIDDQDDELNPGNNINCCSLPESDDYSYWSTYGRDVVVTIDLGATYDLDFIHLFDGNGISHVFFDYLDGEDLNNDDWLPLADYVTIRNNKWHTISNEAPPCQPIRYLRIRSAMNDGRIDELVLCGKLTTGDNLPNADFTFNQDCGTAMFTSAEGTDGPNFTHLWSFGDNATNPSTSTEVNPIFEYPVSGTYTVTHTLTNECGTDVATNTVEIEICNTNECACANGYNIGMNENSVTTLSESGIPLDNGMLSSACVSVNGRFIIDEGFSFNSVVFKMGPDAEIIIDGNYDPERVEMSGCNLRGCEELWQGIKLINLGELDFNNNFISDAIYAIELTDESGVLVTENVFDRNYIGIRIGYNSGGHTSVKTLDNEDAYVYNNLFQCTDDLLEMYTNYIKSYAAVHLYGAVDFNIGLSNNSTPGPTPNTIQDSHYGIFLSSSENCKIVNNEISNLQQSSDNGAIHLYRTLSASIKNNRIQNVGIGVQSYQSSFNCYSNKISTDQTAIYSFADYNVDISWNDLFSETGIDILNSRTGMLPDDAFDFNIFDNEITSTRDGIYVRGGTGSVLIRDNDDIQFNNNGIIISDRTATTTLFDNNLVGDPDLDDVQFRDGIKLRNANNLSIVNNDIDLNEDYFDNSDNSTGIRSQNSGNNFYCCNDLDNCARGISFFGANMSSLNTTTFNRHKRTGLLLYNAIIGQQIDAGNSWEDTETLFEYAKFFDDSENVIQNMEASIFRSNPNLYPGPINENIDVPSEAMASDWFKGPQVEDMDCSDFDFEPDDLNQLNVCEENINLETTGSNPTPGEINPTDISIVEVINFSSPTSKTVNYEAQRQLFRKLKQNESIVYESQILADFYYEEDGLNIGKFDQIDEAINNSRDVKYFLDADFYSRLDYLKQVRLEVDNLGEELVYASAENRITIRNEILYKVREQKELTAQIFDKLNQFEIKSTELLINILGQNDQIQVDKTYEINQKEFNRISLSVALNGLVNVNLEQKSELEQIAFQCFYTGGRAVLQARILLESFGYVYTDRYEAIDKECKIDKAVLKSFEEDKKISRTLKISPNPSSSIFNVDFGKEIGENGQYRVINIVGEVVKYGTIQENKQGIQLDLSNDRPGVYYLEIKGLGNDYLLEKLLLLPTY